MTYSVDKVSQTNQEKNTKLANMKNEVSKFTFVYNYRKRCKFQHEKECYIFLMASIFLFDKNICFSVGTIARWNREEEGSYGSAKIQEEVLRLLPHEVHQWRLQFWEFSEREQQRIWGCNEREEADENCFDEERSRVRQRTVNFQFFISMLQTYIHFWISKFFSLKLIEQKDFYFRNSVDDSEYVSSFSGK